MNTGKTLFAQVMDFLPWKAFSRIVARYDGDSRVRALSCGEQYRAMAFAQLTYRESLRDIETCLSVQTSKLYHMGFSERVRRSTLADANEARNWRIYAELAERLIAQARKLYAGEDLGLELTNTVYALDSTTIEDRRVGLRAGGDHQKTARFGGSLYSLMQVLSVTIFEKMPMQTALSTELSQCDTAMENNQLNLFGF